MKPINVFVLARVCIAALVAGVLLGAAYYAPLSPAHDGMARSPQWPAVRKAYLAKHPTCEACGGKDGLEVHHVIPFHLAPAKELDPKNLITLCTSKSHNCHFLFGHALDWKAYNPHVRSDAARMLRRIKHRRYETEPAKKKVASGPQEPRYAVAL